MGVIMQTIGRLEVIVGSMFSGKSEELLRRLRRAVIARQHVQVFKPAIDNRYSETKVASHARNFFDAQVINCADDILRLLRDDTTVIGIDEVQFLDETIIGIVESLADRGIRVIMAGLDTDFRGEPFGVVPALMARAEQVDKLSAICTVCGEPATRTQRIVNGKPAHYNEPIVVVGASECYEARCRKHHEVPRD